MWRPPVFSYAIALPRAGRGSNVLAQYDSNFEIAVLAGAL
jgi:hypothetical protein